MQSFHWKNPQLDSEEQSHRLPGLGLGIYGPKSSENRDVDQSGPGSCRWLLFKWAEVGGTKRGVCGVGEIFCRPREEGWKDSGQNKNAFGNCAARKHEQD